MEDTTIVLPIIFTELLERVDKMEQLNTVVMAKYYASINNEESLIPEMVSILGPDSFELLVKYFGGYTIRIPRTEDILTIAGRNHDQ